MIHILEDGMDRSAAGVRRHGSHTAVPCFLSCGHVLLEVRDAA